MGLLPNIHHCILIKPILSGRDWSIAGVGIPGIRLKDIGNIHCCPLMVNL